MAVLQTCAHLSLTFPDYSLRSVSPAPSQPIYAAQSAWPQSGIHSTRHSGSMGSLSCHGKPGARCSTGTYGPASARMRFFCWS